MSEFRFVRFASRLVLAEFRLVWHISPTCQHHVLTCLFIVLICQYQVPICLKFVLDKRTGLEFINRDALCFLQALFAKNCRAFLQRVAIAFYRELQASIANQQLLLIFASRIVSGLD